MTDISNPRDRATDRLLQRALGAPSAAGPTSACLDAEALAAWADDGLGDSTRQAADSHVAGCAHCQAVLAAMVRMEPAVAPAPERSRRWALAWLVPVAAAAAVVVWFAIPGKPVLPTSPASPKTESAANAPAPAPISSAELRPPATTVPAGRPAQEPAAPARAQTPAAMDRLSAKDVAAAAPPPKAKPEAAAPMRANEVAPAAAAAGSVTGAIGQSGALAGRPSPLVEIATPSRRTRWRLSGSTIVRSADDGSTWSPVVTGIDAQWTAGSAPAETICWLVGKNGTVAVTADGRTWRKLTAPDLADLASVQADDQKTATVTTVDGRRFRTTDGGLTWVRLQEIPAAPFYG